MFGFGNSMTGSRAINKALGDRVAELTAEAAEKDARIQRLDADCQRMAEKVRDLRAAEARHMRAMAEQVRATDEAKREARVVGKALNEMLAERDAARAALRKIAGMVTPGSAPIGKRMAKVAAGHLAGGDAVQAEAA